MKKTLPLIAISCVAAGLSFAVLLREASDPKICEDEWCVQQAINAGYHNDHWLDWTYCDEYPTPMCPENTSYQAQFGCAGGYCT